MLNDFGRGVGACLPAGVVVNWQIGILINVNVHFPLTAVHGSMKGREGAGHVRVLSKQTKTNEHKQKQTNINKKKVAHAVRKAAATVKA